MFFNYIKLGFINGFTDSESWILMGLCCIFVLFSALSIILLCLRKRGRGKIHVALLVACLVVLLLFIGCAVIISFDMLEKLRLNFGFFNDMAAAYENKLINIVYLAVLGSMLFCFSILLFLPQRAKTALDTANINKSYFSQFDAENDDEDWETITVKDVFKEFGNTDNEVSNSVDRMAEKLIIASRENKSKKVVAELNDALAKGKTNANP